MSTPEHNAAGETGTPGPSTPDPGASLVQRAGREVTGTGTAPTRTTRVVSWLGWHLGEVSTVVAPAGVAVATSPWVAVVSVVAGLRWGVHEWRAYRDVHRDRTGTNTRKSKKDGEEV